MARATRVYVVMEPRSVYNEPVATFTVKYEAQAWLARRAEEFPIHAHTMVYSLPDNPGPGGDKRMRIYTEQEFMEA